MLQFGLQRHTEVDTYKEQRQERGLAVAELVECWLTMYEELGLIPKHMSREFSFGLKSQHWKKG